MDKEIVYEKRDRILIDKEALEYLNTGKVPKYETEKEILTCKEQ
jgi:hypothetical protein